MAGQRNIVVEISGADKLIANMDGLKDKVNAAASRALHEEAEVIMTEAKQRTPVDTGALRGSGRVQTTDTKGAGRAASGRFTKGGLVSHLEFGNASVDYALYVHENTESHHPVGQAKFLESALLDALPTLSNDLGKRISAILKGSI